MNGECLINHELVVGKLFAHMIKIIYIVFRLANILSRQKRSKKTVKVYTQENFEMMKKGDYPILTHGTPPRGRARRR